MLPRSQIKAETSAVVKGLICVLLAITSLLLISSTVLAGWGLQSSDLAWPPPHLRAVHFPVDNSEGFTVGNNGSIIRTLDGGATPWQSLNSGTPSTLRGVFFVDNNTGYAVGDSGTILRTDSGSNPLPGSVSWTTQNNFLTGSCGAGSLPPGTLNSVHFPVDASTGYVVGSETGFAPGGIILKTTDGGASWRCQAAGGFSPLESVYFTDNSNGYAVGSSGTILVTSDGGATWSPDPPPSPARSFKGVSSFSAAKPVVVSDMGYVLTKSGPNWNESQPTTSNMNAVSVVPGGGNRAFMAGKWGSVYETGNGGSSWSDVGPTGTGWDLYGISFPVDQNTGYAVGQRGTVVKFTSAASAAVLISNAGALSAAEGNAAYSATYNVVLATAPASNVTINIASPTSDGQLEIDPATTSLTFTPATWSTPQPVNVRAVDDLVFEGSPHQGLVEHTVASADPSYSGIKVSDVAVDITDNDAAPEVNWTQLSQSGPESAAPLTVRAQLSALSSLDVTVPFSVGGASTASDPADYSLTASPLVIPAGSLFADALITLVDDALDEPDETVVLTLGAPTNATVGANSTHTATISDDDSASTVSFALASSNSPEATTPADLTVNLALASAFTVTVDYAVNAAGTATAGGTDYTLAAGTLTFNPGETSKTISITIAEDALDEADETVIVDLSNPVNATLGATVQHTYTINDNDGSPQVYFDAAASSSPESVTPVSLTVSLSALSGQTVTTNFAVNGASSASGGGVDYTLAAGTLNFAPGETSKIITLTVVDDAVGESDETVLVDLSNPVNATLGATPQHTLTIADNEKLISGTVYADAGVTPVVGGGGVEVCGVRSGSVVNCAMTNPLTGGYSLVFPPTLSAGDPILVYVNNSGGTRGTTVTVSDGGNLSGLDIYDDQVITRYDNAAGSLTVADMNSAKGGLGDSDIRYLITGNDLNLRGTTGLHIPAGHSFDAGSGTIYVAGDFTNRGAFIAGSSTVRLDGTNQALSGSTTFWNLTKQVPSETNHTLTFEAGTTTTIGGQATLRGSGSDDDEGFLRLRSSAPGSQWHFTLSPGATKNIRNVNVRDSVGSDPDDPLGIIAPTRSRDAGNNVNWFWPSLTLDLDADNSSPALHPGFQASFVENDAPRTLVDSDVSISSAINLWQATITLTNPEPGMDTLSVGALPPGIVLDAASTTTSLVLAATALPGEPASSFETALRAVVFNNPSDVPDTTARTITVVVDDAFGTPSNTATSIINVLAQNDAPLSVDDAGAAYGTNEDTAFDTADVLSNDSDVDGDALSIVTFDAASAQGGTVTYNGDGTFRYTPPADFNGSDSFSYYAFDGTVDSADAATVTIVVGSTNDAPVAADDAGGGYGTSEELVFDTADVLSNDSDIDGDALSIVTFDGASAQGGTVSYNGDGTFRYTPPADFNGSDSFTYFAFDGTVDSVSQATVTITVAAVNDPPTISGIPAKSVEQDAFYSFTPVAADPDSDILTFSIGNQPAWASFDQATGTLSGTPGNADVGAMTAIVILVSDGDGGSTSLAPFDLQVVNVNDPPVPLDDAFTAEQDSRDNLLDVLANDSDPDSGDAIAITRVGIGDGGGQLAVNQGRELIYTPRIGFWGDETFTYTIEDASGLSASAAVTVSVREKVADAGHSTVLADPAIVLADGVSTSTITTTLLDRDKQPVSGKNVTWSATWGGIPSDSPMMTVVSAPLAAVVSSGLFDPTLSTSEESGRAVTVLSSTLPGLATITSTDLTNGVALAMQPQVFFTQGQVLELTLSANKDEVLVGDVVTYQVTLKNTVDREVVEVRVENETFFQGAQAADPEGSRNLSFDLGTVPALVDANGNGRADPGEPGYRTISFQAVVGSGAKPGDYFDMAVARDVCEECFVSNPDEAQVTVSLDPLFDLGTVIGKVFEDHDGNGWQDAGEEGVPGAMVALDDGTYALTDAYGRYHFPAVNPGQRLVKLPAGQGQLRCPLHLRDRRHRFGRRGRGAAGQQGLRAAHGSARQCRNHDSAYQRREDRAARQRHPHADRAPRRGDRDQGRTPGPPRRLRSQGRAPRPGQLMAAADHGCSGTALARPRRPGPAAGEDRMGRSHFRGQSGRRRQHLPVPDGGQLSRRQPLHQYPTAVRGQLQVGHLARSGRKRLRLRFGNPQPRSAPGSEKGCGGFPQVP